ncbi:putative long-chain-alcohol O-fatty-acyltransferase 5 [Citrus sinensis]|uniref:Long-chain-alcohol O-fatty-acyltransferase 5 n=1 Tax=Citrus sinensis TaxID=2711 RepID=A0ACB8P1N5_CITSI|nr:putative long-chain-alcohol O-fatty-acyltransferase 5 [Citrus sinensis]
MDGEFKNLLQVWILATTCLTYCYYIPSKIPSGTSRLLSLLPIFYLLTILPLKLHTIHLCVFTAFLLVWLTNFKLLLFAFDQGPLSPPPSKLSHFISIACLPIKLKTNNTNPSRKKMQKPLQKSFPIFSRSTLLAIKVVLFVVLLHAYKYKQYLHQKLIIIICMLYIYLLLETVLAVCSALAQAILGLELEPQFNEPYLSTSLQDFWGRRWNLMVTSILHSTVYDPVRRISTRLIDDKWAALPAVLATFAVSGVMHDIIYCYLTRAPPTWEMTSFFVLHGTCLTMELAAKRELTDGRWRLHPAVSCLLLLVFLLMSSLWLFSPPLLRGGVNEKMMREVLTFANLIKNEGIALMKILHEKTIFVFSI